MVLFLLVFICIFILFGCQGEKKEPVEPGDLVLLNGDVYTVDPENPKADSIVINSNRITAVCQGTEEAEKYIGENTRVIDLKGSFVTPGIIDGHVHFNRAGELINDANLMTVSDEEGFKKEISRVADILDEPEGFGEPTRNGNWVIRVKKREERKKPGNPIEI